jgi:DNA modification methylase
VWDIDHRKSESGHGTQKPVEAMARPMRLHTDPGDRVYDPFLGSGTSVIAAQMNKRICHGCELSPAYVDVIVERWQQFAGADAVLEGTGETFAQVKERRIAQQPPEKTEDVL